jgi:hypothetical protein
LLGDSSRKAKFDPDQKRSKIVIDDVYFDLKFPSAQELAANRKAAAQLFTLEMEGETKITG